MDDIKRVAKILSKADNGCIVCVVSLAVEWIKEFDVNPEEFAEVLASENLYYTKEEFLERIKSEL